MGVATKIARLRSTRRISCILASACLSGTPCRYHGRPDRAHVRRVERIARELRARRIVWICPEQAGGLPTPRPAARRRRGRAWAYGIVGGWDLTPALERGARAALRAARRYRPLAVVLFAKSPSCDPESGVAGRLLAAAGFRLLALGDLRGRQHLITPIGRLRDGKSLKRGGPEPARTKKLLQHFVGAK